MKKYFILSSIITAAVLLLSVTLRAGDTNNTLKGKVKEKTVKEYTVKGANQKSLFKTSQFKFDDEGNVIEETVYNAEGKVIYSCVNNISHAGNKSVETCQAGGKLIFKTLRIKDETGRIIEERVLDGEGRQQTKRLYNYSGNQMEITVYGEGDNVENRTVATLDEKGKVAQETVFNADGSPSGQFSYVRDEMGNMVEKSSFNSKGEFLNKYRYKLDARGNCVEEGWYNGGGALECKTTYKNDAFGNPIEACGYEVNTVLVGVQEIRYIYAE